MYFLATSRSTFAQMYNCSDASAIYGGFCIIRISLTYVFTPTALDDSSSLITLHFRTQLSNVSELMKTFCTEKHTTKCKNNEDVSTTKLLRTVLSSEKERRDIRSLQLINTNVTPNAFIKGARCQCK